MPPTVFVIQPVIRKPNQRLRRARWRIVARAVLIAHEPVGERKIEPALMGDRISPESKIVGIMQTIEIVNDVSEGVRLLIPSIEDKDRSLTVVGYIVHAGDEDAPVWRLCKEAHAAQTA